MMTLQRFPAAVAGNRCAVAVGEHAAVLRAFAVVYGAVSPRRQHRPALARRSALGGYHDGPRSWPSSSRVDATAGGAAT